VLDPFAGVGTTLVQAFRRGLNVVGFEINPYAALAARMKLESAVLPTLDLSRLRCRYIAVDEIGISPPRVDADRDVCFGFLRFGTRCGTP
jgi:tRNA G10  N-methylase Trm11